jgi:hypothetical protein
VCSSSGTLLAGSPTDNAVEIYWEGPLLGFRFSALPDLLRVGLERGTLSLVSTTEGLLGRKSSGSGLENLEHSRRDPSRLCGLVVRVFSYRSSGPGSIPGATRFSEK